MPDPIRRWIASVALCSLPVASCGDVVGPPSSGTYFLREVNGEELPVSWHATDANTATLLSDTLVLSTDQRFHRVRVTQHTDLTTGIAERAVEEWEGSVLRREGSWILLSDICGSDSLALCVPPPRVQTRGSTLAVRTQSPPTGTLLFSPVG
jgi:hypothetical protein